MINIERIPYSWGEVKHGKLGISVKVQDEFLDDQQSGKEESDDSDEEQEINISEFYQMPKKKYYHNPTAIPYFIDLRESLKMSAHNLKMLKDKYYKLQEKQEQQVVSQLKP